MYWDEINEVAKLFMSGPSVEDLNALIELIKDWNLEGVEARDIKDDHQLMVVANNMSVGCKLFVTLCSREFYLSLTPEERDEVRGDSDGTLRDAASILKYVRSRQ